MVTVGTGKMSFIERVAGRLLCYVAPWTAADTVVTLSAATLTGEHAASGLVVRGGRGTDVLAGLSGAARRQPVILDPGSWTKHVATVDEPLALPVDGLFPVSVDAWAFRLFHGGADALVTPSGFVLDGNWSALKAVLNAGAATDDPRIATLVATDAAMLDDDRRCRFLDVVAEQHGHRPLAFVFAAKEEPLARTRRMLGLRAVVDAFPGSLVLAADVLAGMDVVARGGAAAIGLTSGLRRPKRPGDGGFAPAKAWIPGLFLRELWETRSPAIYGDWYANRLAPSCRGCGGRAADQFTDHPVDKAAVLVHNVHAWLQVWTELRQQDCPRAWLVAERVGAFEAHVGLKPVKSSKDADLLLRQLCELDDPQQRRTLPSGRWR